jgi:hypothetical protein
MTTYTVGAPTLVLRASKGSPLLNTEVDANFTNLSNAIQTSLLASTYTAADVLAKLNTVTGAGAASGLNADTVTFGSSKLPAATANTATTLVARDASGNFSAGTITASTFSGTFSGVAAITSGSIALSTALGITSGGTGATSASAARTNLGLAIGTNVEAWSANLDALSGVTSAADTGVYFTGSGTASTYSIPSYGRTLAGSSSASAAQSTLGLVIGTNVQAYSANLAATSGVSSGLISMQSTGSASGVTITAGAGISVSNGNGVGGNPTISAAVTSVQGSTGAVVVSVPVTSVQGNTGGVTVTNISGSAGYASSAGYSSSAGSASYASNAGGGWPYFLSQYGNNLGNYGGWFDNAGACTNGTPGYPGNHLYRSGNGVYLTNNNCNCNC